MAPTEARLLLQAAGATTSSPGLAELARALSPEQAQNRDLPVPASTPAVPADPALEQEELFGSTLLKVLRDEIPIAFHYQPIVDLRRGLVVGYEGLVRFGGGLSWSPDRWFSRAEQYGQRLALEHLVTRKVLQSRGHLPSNCFLSINTSPSFVLSAQWDEMLREIGSLGGVVVEITENEFVSDYKPLCAKLQSIRERGGCVAVDDAGSGYASLHHVMALKPEFVKLDRVFVTDCDTDRAKSALIEMVGKAAGRLDAWVIAEGVETAGELDELIRLNVPLAQGYYLCRPVPNMRALAEDKSSAIVQRVQILTPSNTVETVTECCPVCMSEADAAQVLLDHQQVHTVAVTDLSGRPLYVVERHPLLGVRTLPALMRTQAGTSDVEVLERALTRLDGLRFDPLVAINEQGELVGLVRIDRLMKQISARL